MFPILRDNVDRASDASESSIKPHVDNRVLPHREQASNQSGNASRVTVVQYTPNFVKTALFIRTPHTKDSELQSLLPTLITSSMNFGKCDFQVCRISPSSDCQLVLEVTLTSPVPGEPSTVLAQLRSSLADPNSRLNRSISSVAVSATDRRRTSLPSRPDLQNSAVSLPGGLVARRQSQGGTLASAVVFEVIASGHKVLDSLIDSEISCSVVTLNSSAASELLGISDFPVLVKANRDEHILLVSSDLNSPLSLFAGLNIRELSGLIGERIEPHLQECQASLIEELGRVKQVMEEGGQRSLKWKKPIMLFAISGLLNGFVLQEEKGDFTQYLNFAIDHSQYERIKQLSTAVQAIRVRDIKTWLVALASSQTVKYSSAWLGAVALAASDTLTSKGRLDMKWEEFVETAVNDGLAQLKRLQRPTESDVTSLVLKFRSKVVGAIKADELVRTFKWKLQNVFPVTAKAASAAVLAEPAEAPLSEYEALLETAIEEVKRSRTRLKGEEFEREVKIEFFKRGKETGGRLKAEVARGVFNEWRAKQSSGRRATESVHTRSGSLEVVKEVESRVGDKRTHTKGQQVALGGSGCSCVIS